MTYLQRYVAIIQFKIVMYVGKRGNKFLHKWVEELIESEQSVVVELYA